MSMGHDLTMSFYLEDSGDYSEKIKEAVGIRDMKEDDFRWNIDFSKRKNNYAKYKNQYEITYSARGYLEHIVIVEYAESLAKAIPHCRFYVDAGAFNEGSGGNYHDEISINYEYGTLSYKYYCDYDVEYDFDSGETPKPKLCDSDTRQLFPKSDFLEDIANAEQYELALKTAKIKGASGKVFISTGLTPDEEAFVKDAVNRSGGEFKPHFVKSVDYLVYNPDYERETTKLRDARALKKEGKDVKIITFDEFKELLMKNAPKPVPAGQKTSGRGKTPGTREYRFSSNVSFELPKGYEAVKDKDEDGNESFTIRAQPYTNDDGEKRFYFLCGVRDCSFEYTGPSKGKSKLSGRDILEGMGKGSGNVRYFLLPGTPDGMMLCTVAQTNLDDKSELNALANLIMLLSRPFMISLRILLDQNPLLECMCIGSASQNDDPSYMPKFEGMVTVANAVRINGEPLQTGNLTPKVLESVFSPRTIDYKTGADLTSELKGILSGNQASVDYGSSYNPISKETGAAKPVTSGSEFRKLSDTISVKKKDSNLILVNNEWTFKMPSGFKYAVDSEFDGGIQGAIDLSGSTKPLVLKGVFEGSKPLFNFALEKHADFSGNYFTIIDCKYDNRITDSDSLSAQKILIDQDDFYVDMISVNTFPFGVNLQIRVRGTGIEPFNFDSMVKDVDEDEFKKIVSAMIEIGSSIRLEKRSVSSGDGKKGGAAKASSKKSKDPDCIIDGTTLQKYIGTNRDVVLPDGLTAIADNVFSGRKIRSVVVPEGVTSIGRRVFENCFELEEASLPSTLETLGWYGFVDCHKLKKITLGNSLTSIENSMFSECFELENVVIPDTVQYIDSFAFKNCQKFTSIVIPDGVKSIGISAFVNCTELSYLYIPASVAEMREPIIGGGTPFDGCGKLTVHTPAGSYAESYCKSHGIRCVADSNPVKVQGQKRPSSAGGTKAPAKQPIDSGCVIEGTVLKQYKGSSKDVVLPGGLTAVAEKAFTRKKIRSVCIPEGVTAVEKEAFASCYDLEEATLPSTLRELGSDAFKDCHKLRRVTLRSMLSEIKYFTFYGCYELEDIVIPWTVEEIGIYAFKECKRLTSVVIPERVKTIGSSAFQDCKNLSYLFIPASVTELGVSSYDNGTPFTGCRKLTIHCPAGSYAEMFCKSHGLKYVTESRPKSPQELRKLYPVPPVKTADKKVSESSVQPTANPIGFPVAEPEASQRRLLDRKPKKTDGPNRFDLAFVSMTGDPYYEDALRRFYPNQFGSREFWSKIESLLKVADELVTAFRNDEEAVDRETELRNGLIRKAYTLHAFKSFIWTSGEYCRQNKMEYDAFGFDRTLELAQFIYDRGGVNWKPVDKQAKRFGALLLKKAEKEYCFDKEDVDSLTEFLLSLEPLMRQSYEYLKQRSDQLTDADRMLAEFLAGWCAFSFACYFGKIRAVGGPEDFVPEKCRALPEAKLDVLNEYYYVTPGGTCVACKDPGDTIEFPEGIKRVLIPLLERGVSGTEEYYYHAKKVIFPKSCNESQMPNPPREAKEAVFKADYEIIEPDGWHDPNYWERPKGKELALEKLSFLGSATRLKDFALSHMQNLRELKLPENIREFGWGSVENDPSLKEIVLPPTVEKVDRNVFGESYDWEQSNKRTIIVEKGSKSEETMKRYAADKKHLVIKVIPSREEQARIAEENRLKAVAESLRRALTDAYRDDLEESGFDSLKSRIGESVSRVCDRKTWSELRHRGISAIPSANLTETNRKIASSASPEDAYDQLPEWIAAEYIKVAEENRKAAEEKRARQAFAGVLKELTGLSRESIRGDFEKGVEKNEYLGGIVSRAKALINDSEHFADNLKKYDGMTELETLRYYLGRRDLDSVESVIDALADKKASEYDRLTALLEKKNADLEAIWREEEQLKEERGRLGLFQIKRKKEIDALLAAIPGRIDQLQKEFDGEKLKF